jgi:hypothetical protein
MGQGRSDLSRLTNLISTSLTGTASDEGALFEIPEKNVKPMVANRLRSYRNIRNANNDSPNADSLITFYVRDAASEINQHFQNRRNWNFDDESVDGRSKEPHWTERLERRGY